MARVGAPRIRREKLLAKLGRIIENIERNPIFMKEVKPGSTIDPSAPSRYFAFKRVPLTGSAFAVETGSRMPVALVDAKAVVALLARAPPAAVMPDAPVRL